MRPGAIVQVRMSSQRLPGKVLADLEGRPMLARIVERLRLARSLDFVGVATSELESDDPIANYCMGEGIPCYRGSLEDVLGRYVEASRLWELDPVVRITGDCPFVCPDVVDRLVEAARETGADYSEFDRPTLHEGIDVFSRDLLERFHAGLASREEREHLALIPDHHRSSLRITRVPAPAGQAKRNGLSLSVDTLEDLEFARRLYRQLRTRPQPFTTRQLTSHLDSGDPPSLQPAVSIN